MRYTKWGLLWVNVGKIFSKTINVIELEKDRSGVVPVWCRPPQGWEGTCS